MRDAEEREASCEEPASIDARRDRLAFDAGRDRAGRRESKMRGPWPTSTSGQGVQIATRQPFSSIRRVPDLGVSMRGSGELRYPPRPFRPSWAGRERRTLAAGVLAVSIAGCGRFGYDEFLAPIGRAGAGSGDGGSAGRDTPGSGGGGGGASPDSGILPPATGGASGATGTDGGSDGDGGSAGSAVDSGTPPVPTPTCTDGVVNGAESGVDCGGASCAPCPCTFGAPELLTGPNFAGNDILAVSLAADALTMYIGGRIQGGSRPIAITTRPNRGNSFSFASLLPAPVNANPAVEGTPFISRNELALIFFSERGGGGDRDLYGSERGSTAAGFDSVIHFINVNSPERDHSPWLSPDVRTLYFSSRRASADDDIWRSTRVMSGIDFPEPTPVTELNSIGNDAGIYLTDDGLVAYFASDRTEGLGGMDIYRAARAAATEAFSAPELVPGLNTIADDAAPHLTADGQELFFVSDRNGNDSQIFRVSSVCP
jgi:hypothetical protein